MPDASDPTPELAVDDWVEDYLMEVVEGDGGDLEAWCGRIEDDLQRSLFRARALAEEYLWRRAEGEAVEMDEFLQRLPEGEERDAFRQICRDSSLADRHLPGNLTPGSLFAGRYVIQHELGRGGTGVVYAAVDRELERDVALKVFNYEALTGSPDEWESTVLKESKALASLKSRNIVTVYDAKRGRHESFLVMDRIHGRDLFGVLEEVRRMMSRESVATGASSKRVGHLELAVGTEPEGERENLFQSGDWYATAARILREVAFTIELAHDRGVVHRDIKSTNILLVSGGEPVLLDFGLSAGRGGSLENDGFRGTPEYIAPEQARHMTTGTDPRTDIYQLGLVLYELLTLQRAYTRGEDEQLLAFLSRIERGEAVRPSYLDPKVPKALDAICAKAMERELSDRYESARQMRVDLERFLAGLPPRHADVPSSSAAWMRVRYVAGNPVTKALAAALLVFVGVLALLPEKWYPPSMQDFLFMDSASTEVAVATGKEFVEYRGGKAWLGMDLQVNSESWLYTFGIFETEPGVRRIFPTNAAIAPAMPSSGEPEPLRIEDNARIICSVIEDADEYEGFLAYATREPSTMLAQLQQDTENYYVEHGAAMPWDYFQQRIDEFQAGARGARVQEFSEEEVAILFKGQAPEVTERDRLWRELGVKPFERLVQVVRP